MCAPISSGLSRHVFVDRPFMETQVKLPNWLLLFITNAYSHLGFKTHTHTNYTPYIWQFDKNFSIFFDGFIRRLKYFSFNFQFYTGTMFYYCGLRRFCNIEQWNPCLLRLLQYLIYLNKIEQWRYVLNLDSLFLRVTKLKTYLSYM